jgi:hypothetical protein
MRDVVFHNRIAIRIESLEHQIYGIPIGTRRYRMVAWEDWRGGGSRCSAAR